MKMLISFTSLLISNVGPFWRITCIMLFSLSALVVRADVDTHQFDNQAQAERFRSLILEMRCPKCQNQDLADSDAPIAKDLRNEIALLITQKKSDDDIKNYMVNRYGEFILYKPKFSGYSLIVWLVPLILLLIGVGVVCYLVRGNRQQPVTEALDSQHHAQAIKAILADKDVN